MAAIAPLAAEDRWLAEEPGTRLGHISHPEHYMASPRCSALRAKRNTRTFARVRQPRWLTASQQQRSIPAALHRYPGQLRQRDILTQAIRVQVSGRRLPRSARQQRRAEATPDPEYAG